MTFVKHIPLCGAIVLTALSHSVFSQSPSSAPSMSFEKHGFQFLPSERDVILRREGKVIVGRLDMNGTFIPYGKERQPHATAYADMKAVAINDRKRSSTIIHSLEESPEIELVYEYRSAVLIPGHLDRQGCFVPTVGGAIIPFSQYLPGDSARRVYNLPGTFIPIRK